MDIIRLMKRKDAASVLVAVVLAMVVGQAVESWATRPAEWLSGVSSLGGGWRAGVWEPLMVLLVELVVLELVIRLYVWLMGGGSVKKR